LLHVPSPLPLQLFGTNCLSAARTAPCKTELSIAYSTRTVQHHHSASDSIVTIALYQNVLPIHVGLHTLIIDKTKSILNWW